MKPNSDLLHFFCLELIYSWEINPILFYLWSREGLRKILLTDDNLFRIILNTLSDGQTSMLVKRFSVLSLLLKLGITAKR